MVCVVELELLTKGLFAGTGVTTYARCRARSNTEYLSQWAAKILSEVKGIVPAPSVNVAMWKQICSGQNQSSSFVISEVWLLKGNNVDATRCIDGTANHAESVDPCIAPGRDTVVRSGVVQINVAVSVVETGSRTPSPVDLARWPLEAALSPESRED